MAFQYGTPTGAGLAYGSGDISSGATASIAAAGGIASTAFFGAAVAASYAPIAGAGGIPSVEAFGSIVVVATLVTQGPAVVGPAGGIGPGAVFGAVSVYTAGAASSVVPIVLGVSATGQLLFLA